MQEKLAGHNINVILPQNYNAQNYYAAVFINDGDRISLWENKLKNSLVFGMIPNSRLDEYTPWREKALREDAKDFGGEADAYLLALTRDIIPAIKSRYRIEESKIAFGGFSLGGLVSVYSLYNTTEFQYVFSICGSFWFPKFVDFVKKTEVINKEAEVFLINGLQEGSNHDNILEKAPQAAESVGQELAKQMKICNRTFDNYGHHEAMKARIENVVEWLRKHNF